MPPEKIHQRDKRRVDSKIHRSTSKSPLSIPIPSLCRFGRNTPQLDRQTSSAGSARAAHRIHKGSRVRVIFVHGYSEHSRRLRSPPEPSTCLLKYVPSRRPCGSLRYTLTFGCKLSLWQEDASVGKSCTNVLSSYSA